MVDITIETRRRARIALPLVFFAKLAATPRQAVGIETSGIGRRPILIDRPERRRPPTDTRPPFILIVGPKTRIAGTSVSARPNRLSIDR